MGMRRVEVVVRFAGDLHEIVEVSAGETVLVGDTPVVAKAGTELTIGLATVTMTAAGEPSHLPRRRIDRRPFGYAVGSLAAQLALVALSLALFPEEPPTAPALEVLDRHPGSARISRVAAVPQTTEQAPEPAPVETPITKEQTPEHVERDAPPPPAVDEFVPSEITGGGLTDGPTDADGTSRFDPGADPAFDTIKVGAYSTVASGRGAGDDYAPHVRNSSLVVITCDRASCLVLGGEKAVRVREAVNERLAELTDCYKESAETGGGSVEIDFAVDQAGAIDDFAIGDADPASRCVARILRTLDIDQA